MEKKEILLHLLCKECLCCNFIVILRIGERVSSNATDDEKERNDKKEGKRVSFVLHINEFLMFKFCYLSKKWMMTLP